MQVYIFFILAPVLNKVYQKISIGNAEETSDSNDGKQIGIGIDPKVALTDEMEPFDTDPDRDFNSIRADCDYDLVG